MDVVNDVKLVRVEDVLSVYLPKVQSTYISSFPEVERRDFNLFCDLLKSQPLFHLYVILKEEAYVGFITFWHFEQFVYVEHFAIDSASRGGGIGSVVMREALKQANALVVLEVEPPVDDLSIRRIRFYEALGFTLYETDYKQPPYRSGDSWYEMKLMGYGDVDMEIAYPMIRDGIYTYVYQAKKPS
jgi:ribosomal protein S18 acetylase RimI-like enzyme